MYQNKNFSFNEQKKVGLDGESDFLKFYSEENPRKSLDRKYDFLIRARTKVELKTDTYSMEKTENFFMEKYSDINKMLLGGPWRAANDRINYFVYYFLLDGVFFWFRPNELVFFLDSYIEKKHEKIIRSHSWFTLGYIIPRKDLKHLMIRTDVSNSLISSKIVV
jgi:hypothetical protein